MNLGTFNTARINSRGVKPDIFNFTKENRTLVLWQAKFEEPELSRCRYVNQVGFQDISIHTSTFAMIYYEDCRFPV
jgi:hypothetical protein